MSNGSPINPRHDARFHRYQRLLLSNINPKDQRGLEIGALDLPFITPNEGLIQFADYNDTETLRKIAAAAPGHSPEFVQPVDFILSQSPLETLPSLYEWVAAAHVIEHVPDLISWLNAIAGRLVANGLLFCVIPDGRYTFDIHRPSSTLGKILQDYIESRKSPSFSSVFDANYYHQSASAEDVWGDRTMPNVLYHNDFGNAWAVATQSLQAYIDCHNNVFTPASFSEIIGTLSNENYILFTLEYIEETEFNGIDFPAILRKRCSAATVP
jgi:hypothetical protein